jgi:hypothetical protein
MIKMRWVGHVARMGEVRNAYRVLVGKPEQKRPLGTPRYEDNIKIVLQYIVWYSADRINLGLL